MKNIIFAILLAVTVTVSASASELRDTKAISSSAVVDVLGNKEENMVNDKVKNENQLPVAAKRTFSKMFEGYKIKQAIRFTGEEGDGFYISAENEKESIIVAVNEDLEISIFKKVKK